MPDPSALVDAEIDMVAAIESLGQRHRELYELIAKSELSYAEAAKTLQIPEGTVRSRIHVIRQHIAEYAGSTPRVSIADQKKRTVRRGKGRDFEVRFDIPGTGRVRVVNLRYHDRLTMDLYFPPDFSMDRPIPLVVFVMGWPDELFQQLAGIKLKDLLQYPCWCSLIAASGMAAVAYETTDPAQNIHRLINTLREKASLLSIDVDNLALWVCSANAPIALHALIARDQPYHRALRGAVFYYPSFTELPGQRRKAPKVLDEPLPTTIPIQLVRVGKERPDFQESAARFLEKLKRENVPLESIQHSQAVHGFDYTSEDEETVRIIKRTITFLKNRLHPDGSQK
jgi:hypothetical protein